ncbi:MAG: phosphatidate cytidylyltransferase, partial [Longimicrobiales bacterium]
MSELSKRVAVAVVAIPIVLGLAYLGGWFLAVPLSAFAAWGAHEAYRLAHAKGTHPIEWVGVPAAALLVLLGAWRPTFAGYAPFGLAVIIGTSLLAAVEAMRTRGADGNPLPTVSVTVFGAIYSGLALTFIPFLLALPDDRAWTAADSDPVAPLLVVALPLAATWIGDASAYFAGTTWGKGRARLAPTISPKYVLWKNIHFQ